jgi:toxin ParE1/3/4
MRRVRLSVDADQDLANIRVYFRPRNAAAGERIIRAIRARCKLLGQFPGLGRPRPELVPGLRSSPVDKYVIYFRSAAGGVEVIRILYGAMNVTPDMFPP